MTVPLLGTQSRGCEIKPLVNSTISTKANEKRKPASLNVEKTKPNSSQPTQKKTGAICEQTSTIRKSYSALKSSRLLEPAGVSKSRNQNIGKTSGAILEAP